LKVVVVDNSPMEYSLVSRYSTLFPNVTFIPNPANTGFGAANNIGAAAVDSDYILFFNNDTELTEPVFKKIIAQFKENEKLGCLGIRQEGGGRSYFQRRYVTLSKKEIKQIKKTEKYDSRLHFFPGAFMFFRREAFEKCGRFDEMFFMYCEEVDILNRLQQNGYENRFDDRLCFWHKVGNRKTFNENMIYIGNESLYIYLRKYNIPNPKKKYFGRLFIIGKQVIYNLLLLHFKEVAMLLRALRKTRNDYYVFQRKYSHLYL
jgi:GT2 family glycosyltransferase